MAITAKTNRNMALLTQQRVRWVFGSMTAAETTVNISVRDFKVITGASVSYVGAPTLAMGPISVNESVASDGSKLSLNTTGILRVDRVAHDGAAINFQLLIFGY